MAVDPDFLNHVIDLFSGHGPIRKGRLFGGTSLYVEDAMFAFISGDIVYMKADDALRLRYQEAGSEPFSYATKTGNRMITGLMSLPDSALDDPDEALEWLALSLVPARIAASEKRRKKTK